MGPLYATHVRLRRRRRLFVARNTAPPPPASKSRGALQDPGTPKAVRQGPLPIAVADDRSAAGGGLAQAFSQDETFEAALILRRQDGVQGKWCEVRE